MAVMGYREYARHHGCHLNAVQKAIDSGRIAAAVILVDGKKKIDSERADALWVIATDQAMQRGEAAAVSEPAAPPLLEGVVEQAPPSLSRRPEWEVPFPPISEVTLARAAAVALNASAQANANVVDGATFQEWRTREQRANALAAERELAKQDHSLLDAEETIKAFNAMGKMYAQGRESVPAQLAPRLVGLTDLREIERIVRDAYRASDVRIANEIRNRFAEIHRDAVAAG